MPSDQPQPSPEIPDRLRTELEDCPAPVLQAVSNYAEQLAEYREQEEELENTSEGDVDSSHRETPDGVPTKATVTVKEINGNRYRYWQWRDRDKVKSQYIGPATGEQ